jgi:restriction endonuclease Mrr
MWGRPSVIQQLFHKEGFTMAVPDFQSIMLPLLERSGDGKARSLADSREAIAEVFNLSQEERDELLPSGKQQVLNIGRGEMELS